MKNKWKYTNEMLTAIILTGTMLLVPMYTYAASEGEQIVNEDNQKIVSPKDTSEEELIIEEITDNMSTSAIVTNAKSTAGVTYAAPLITPRADIPGLAYDSSNEAASNSVAVGGDAKAKGQGSIAVGNSAEANVLNATAIGYQAKVKGEGGVAVGEDTTVNGTQGIIVGYQNSVDAYGVMIGGYGHANQYAVAVGIRADAKNDAVALGAETNAAKNAVAVGKNAKANGENSVAVGADSSVDENVENSVALGTNSKVTSADLLSGYTKKFDWDAVDGKANGIGVVSIGSAGAERRMINVANGRIADGSTDAVNGGQLYAVWKELYDQITQPTEYPGNATNTSSAGNSTAAPVVSTSDTYSAGNTNTSLSGNDASTTTDPDGNTSSITKPDFQLVNGNQQIQDKTGADISFTTAAGDVINTGYKADSNGNIDLQIKDKDSGETRHVIITDVASAEKLETVNTKVEENTTKIEQNTQDIANITVNIDQYTQGISELKQSVSQLDSRLDRVGAGAAALAALHPLDYDPDAKWDFAAGYGNYGGASAVALGAYYRHDEDTMFSIGGSFGGGENMVNAGYSVKIRNGGSRISTSRVVMAKEIKAIEKRNEDMVKKLEDMQKEMAAMKATMRTDKA